MYNVHDIVQESYSYYTQKMYNVHAQCSRVPFDSLKKLYLHDCSYFNFSSEVVTCLLVMAEAAVLPAPVAAEATAGESDEQVVNPWEVKTGSSQGIDYEKLIRKI